MNKNILINSEAFQQNISDFEMHVNKVTEYLQKIDNQMKQIDGNNELWKSRVAVCIHDDHMDLQKKFDDINKELSSYVTFLKNTLANYKTQESNIDKAIENNSSNLDVNE